MADDDADVVDVREAIGTILEWIGFDDEVDRDLIRDCAFDGIQH